MANYLAGLQGPNWLQTSLQGSGLAASQPYGSVQMVVTPGDNDGSLAGAVRTIGPGEGLPAGGTLRPALFVESSGASDWFELFHIIPRKLTFGNLLANQAVPLEVYSAFRTASHTWTNFINGAGAGTTLVVEPPLPDLIYAQQGVKMNVDVSTVGVPFVNALLQFFFDVGGEIDVPITITRIVVWWLRPEAGFNETLSFLTDIYRAVGGTERRASMRKTPRQSWKYKFSVEEIQAERQVLENLLFDWQERVFGVPVWFEETALSVAANTGDLTINVVDTTSRDFRVGGLAIVLCVPTTIDPAFYDVLTIGAIGATTITFTTPLANSYAVGVAVLPLRTCYANKTISSAREIFGLASISIDFAVLDNDISIASTAAFSSFNGKVLLDGYNLVPSNTVPETFDQDLIVIDNETGIPFQTSLVDRHRRGHIYTFRAQGQLAVWQLRQLFHALRGRQISFYAIVDTENLLPILNLVNGSTALDIQNVGYTQFIRQRQPKNVIRITFVDTTISPLFRNITGAVIVDSTHETLTVDVAWPTTYTPAQIARIEYVEKVRFDSDDIVLNYDVNGAVVRASVPVIAVFE